jgi:hypothetical protein
MFNLRGQHQYLYQQNMKVAIPVLVSTRGYGVLQDHYSLMTFHDDAFGSYLWTDVTDELDYFKVCTCSAERWSAHKMAWRTGWPWLSKQVKEYICPVSPIPPMSHGAIPACWTASRMQF